MANIVQRIAQKIAGKANPDAVRPESGTPEAGTIPEELQGQEIYSPGDLFRKSDDCEARKARLKRGWREALAIYHKHHWLASYQNTTGGFDGHWFVDEQADAACQTTVNLWRGKADALVGLFTAGKPLPRAVPIGTDSDDVGRARATDGLLRHMWSLTKHQSVLIDMVKWGVISGTGYYKVYWDPDAGVPVPDVEWDETAGDPIPVTDENGVQQTDPATGEPLTTPSGAWRETGTYSMSGCLIHESLPPFNVGFMDGVPFERSPWVYHRSGYDPDVLWERFGAKCKPDTWPEDLDTGGVMRMDVPHHSGDPSMVEVIEWWQRPSVKHPIGLHIIATRERRLLVEAWPKEKPIPIIMWRANTVPGSPWGVSAGTDAIDPQKVLNSIWSDLAMKVSEEGEPSWLGTEEQANNHHFERGPGRFNWVKTIDNTNNPPPQQIKLAPMSDANMKMFALAKEAIADTWRIPDVFQGMIKDDESSGRAISYRISQTNQNFTAPGAELAQVEKDCWMMSLELWRKYGPEKETIEVVGPDGNAALRPFLREEISYRTLELDESSILVMSPAAINEQVERWVTAKLLTPEEGRRLATMRGLSSLDQADAGADDRAWARENIELYLKEGVVPVILRQMNRAIHFEETCAWAKKPEWRSMDTPVHEATATYLAQLEAQIRQDQGAAQPPDPNAGGSGPKAVADTTAVPAGGGGESTSLPGNPSPTTSQVGEPGGGGPGVDAAAEAGQRAQM
ncbi:MAG: hypothetical protein WC789_10625 [Lentisphaeria bacterium]